MRQEPTHPAADTRVHGSGFTPAARLMGLSTPQPVAVEQGSDELVLEKPSILLKMNWADVVGDVSFAAGERSVRIETAPFEPGLTAPGPWLLVTGRAGAELFALLIEQRFALMLARHHDRDMRRFPAEPGDGALLMEFCLQPLLENLEAELGKPITLELADSCATVPAHSWLCLAATSGEDVFQIGLAPGPAAMGLLSELAESHADPAEKQVSDRLIVKVGPVALPTEEALTSGPGDKFDTGIDPAGEVRGVLERSDGKFWPILIDDDEVTIAGDLRPPINLDEPSGKVLVGFEIGEIVVGARDRRAITIESRLPVNRVPGNGVIIWLNRATHGNGRLDLVDGSLAVAIDTSGDD